LRDRKRRKEQIERIEAALRILRETYNPMPKWDARAARRVYTAVARAVIGVAKYRAEYEDHYSSIRKLVIAGQHRIVAALRRVRYPTAITPTLDPLIEHLIAETLREPILIKDKGLAILNGPHPKEMAAERALKLLRIHGAPSKRKGREKLSVILPATTRNKPWCRLAAILYGDPKADLFQYVRKIAKKHRAQIRYLPAKKTL
jgi:hypothetical protein